MTSSADERTVGWRLARRVAASSLYEELSDLERAECDELVARGNPADAAASERPPEGVACRLAFCTYKADCERTSYCQAAILKTAAYRGFLCMDVLPTLDRLAKMAEADWDGMRIAGELRALHARANRII